MSFFIDMETLGIKETSIILSIGTLFIPEYRKIEGVSWEAIKKEFGKRYRLDVDEQESVYGRTMDVSTIKWWLKQKPDTLRDNLSQEFSYSLEEAFDEIDGNLYSCDFLGKSMDGSENCIWSRGLFDAKLWESIADNLGKQNSIPYWKWRDTRTACNVIGNDSNGGIEKVDGLTLHDPLDDCVLDFIRLNRLGIVK